MPGPVDPFRRGTHAPHPAVRASDAERERTIDVLRDAAAEGRLTFEELADRIETADGAAHRHQLGRLTADLPSSTELGSTEAAEAADVERRSAVFADLRRTGPWRVPEQSRWSTFLGDVVLDLHEAMVPRQRIQIDARSVFGDIVLLVPAGVAVEVQVRADRGTVRQRAGRAAPDGAPTVVLTGGTRFGDVRVMDRRLRDRLTALLRRR